MNLSAYGKGHRALSRLSEGPATMAELRRAAGVTDNQAKKLAFQLGMMMTRGLVSKTPGHGYEITADGLAALATLSAGQDVTVHETTPNARVFRSKETGRAEQASRRAA